MTAAGDVEVVRWRYIRNRPDRWHVITSPSAAAHRGRVPAVCGALVAGTPTLEYSRLDCPPWRPLPAFRCVACDVWLAVRSGVVPHGTPPPEGAQP